MEDKATKKQSFLFGAGSVTLIAGVIACIATANVWSDTSVFIMGGVFLVADIAIWAAFVKSMKGTGSSKN